VFLLTLLYWLRPGKVVRVILWAFFLLNPLPLYVANYISADALFIGCSLLWLSSLLWVLYRPRPYLILVQGVLLLACFTLRYNAIYYPLITALAFILSQQHWSKKLAGIGFGSLLIGCSILYTSSKMEEVTGHRQFSAFGGWQLANNALYMYEHIPASERGTVPAKFAKLEKMVREHMDTLSKVKFTHEDSVNGYFYLWSGRGPLIQYMAREWKNDSTTPYIKRWSSEGPLYAEYALHLITSHPMAFAGSFLLGNAVKYAVPPLEFLGTYNMGADSVGKMAKDWFNYKSQRVADKKKRQFVSILQAYPVFGALVNLCFFMGCVGFLVFGGIKQSSKKFSSLLLVIAALGIANGGFSLFSAPIVLRYQVFPILLFGVFAAFLIEFLLKEHRPAAQVQPVLN